ncbi:MAG: hypothetical protein HGA54_04905 [Actinobacteria bacterium]|nr:hypothetical protein [Actinomycetota bacterium]
METEPDKKDKKPVKYSDDEKLVKKSDSEPPVDPPVCAACEDDDGYDPYSDRRESERLFERDPWR